MLTGSGRLSSARSCARSPLLAQGWCCQVISASHHRSSAHSALPGLAAPALAPQGVPRALLPTDDEHLALASGPRIVHELQALPLPELEHGASLAVADTMMEVEALIAAHEAGLVSVQPDLGPQHAVVPVASPAQEADADSAAARSSGTASTSSSSSTGSGSDGSGRRRSAGRSTPSRSRGRGGGGNGASPAAPGAASRPGSKPASVTAVSHTASPAASAAANSASAAPPAPVALSAAGAAALQGLQGRTPSLAAVDPAQLGQRLLALAALLHLGTDMEALALCEAVPGLLLQEPAALDRSWRRLRHTVAGTDDQVRRAICVAPLLLLLPSSRVAQVGGVLAAALGVTPQRARALIRELPALFVMPPATLSEKLTGLENLLCCCNASGNPGTSSGNSASSSNSGVVGGVAAASSSVAGSTTSAAASRAALAASQQSKRAGPAARSAAAAAAGAAGQAKAGGAAPAVARTASQHMLEEALLRAPRLLTFRTATLQSHVEQLAPLLGGPGRAAALLRADPALLERSPSSLAAKMALLRELLGCAHQPAAVAVLVGRAPGLLHRSSSALARTCRSLSIWSLSPRTKLRMALARPGLLQLGWSELHGRCRWLRRLILSNGYYHSALRRLPPSLLAALVAALPGCWARLQYLADSSQEGALSLMEAAECEAAAFETRFPEFAKWYAWKVKQMGTDNPWRGARRVRGIGSAPAAVPGAKPRRSFTRRNGQQQSQQAGQDQQPTVQVVLTEACVVRSGGATVTRPRRVVQQRLDAGAAEAEDGTAAGAEHVIGVEPAVAAAGDGAVVAGVEQVVAAAAGAAAARHPEGEAADSPRRRERR